VRLIPWIEYRNVNGLADKIVGLGRELAGIAFDHDDLIRAGEAQQAKGTERLKELRAEAKASTHARRARTEESRQRAAQRERADAHDSKENRRSRENAHV
jgi:hypothetical protein